MQQYKLLPRLCCILFLWYPKNFLDRIWLSSCLNLDPTGLVSFLFVYGGFGIHLLCYSWSQSDLRHVLCLRGKFGEVTLRVVQLSGARALTNLGCYGRSCVVELLKEDEALPYLDIALLLILLDFLRL